MIKHVENNHIIPEFAKLHTVHHYRKSFIQIWEIEAPAVAYLLYTLVYILC